MVTGSTSSTLTLDQREKGKGRTWCENGLSKLGIIIPDVSMTRVTPINSISGFGENGNHDYRTTHLKYLK